MRVPAKAVYKNGRLEVLEYAEVDPKIIAKEIKNGEDAHSSLKEKPVLPSKAQNP